MRHRIAVFLRGENVKLELNITQYMLTPDISDDDGCFPDKFRINHI